MVYSMSKPLTIMGFMGSGKSTIGRMVAASWNCRFIDLDHHIEESYKMSIPRIFELYHESGFRAIEAKILSDVLLESKECVISLGGGTPCFGDNLQLILEKSVSIYLKVSAQELATRLQRSANPRPLVAGKNSSELIRYIDDTLRQREPFYLQAEHVIESDCLQASDLLTFISRGN